MRCIGRTKKLTRCQRKAHFLVCRQHLFQLLVVVFVTIPAVIVTSIQLYKELKPNAKPNTFIFVLVEKKQTHLENLQRLIPVNKDLTKLGKVMFYPLQASRNCKDVSPEHPLVFSDWAYPDHAKKFTFSFQNFGNSKDRNVRVEINFHRSSIHEINIFNENRIHILGGGQKTSSFVDLVIPELLESEQSRVEIVVTKDTKPTINGWSEISGKINNICIFDVLFVPVEDIPAANRLKLPIDIYKYIKTNEKFLYALNNPPRQSQVYTLSEIPAYLKEKYDFKKSNQKMFFDESNRFTKKGRELYYSYSYAKLLDKYFKSENVKNHVSVMIPEADNIISSYIRIVGKNDLAALPLRIVEAKIKDKFTKEDILQGIYDIIKMTNLKPMSESATLLCAISSEKQIWSTIGEFRTKFENEDIWNYDKILFIQTYDIGTFVYTVYLKDKKENHFMLNDLNGEFEIRAEGKSISF